MTNVRTAPIDPLPPSSVKHNISTRNSVIRTLKNQIVAEAAEEEDNQNEAGRYTTMIDEDGEIVREQSFTHYEEQEIDVFRYEEEVVHAEREWYGRAFLHLDVKVEPREVQQYGEESQVFRHLITNDSKFSIVCRILSTAGKFLEAAEGPFIVIQPQCVRMLRIKKEEGLTRTELVVVDCMPVDPRFQKLDHWQKRASVLFEIGRQPIRFKIRYRKVPQYSLEVEKLFNQKISIGDEGKNLTKLFKESSPFSLRKFLLLDLFCNLMWTPEKEKTKTDNKEDK